MPTRYKKLYFDGERQMYWLYEEVELMVSRYKRWCQNHNKMPEVRSITDVTEENISQLVPFYNERG